MEELKTSKLGIQNKSLNCCKIFFSLIVSNSVGWDGSGHSLAERFGFQKPNWEPVLRSSWDSIIPNWKRRWKKSAKTCNFRNPWKHFAQTCCFRNLFYEERIKIFERFCLFIFHKKIVSLKLFLQIHHILSHTNNLHCKQTTIFLCFLHQICNKYGWS